MKRDFGTGEYEAVEVTFTNPGGAQWTEYELSTGVRRERPREIADPAQVNVNINNGFTGAVAQAQAERIEQQKKLIRLLTVEEGKQYLALMAKAAERQKQQ